MKIHQMIATLVATVLVGSFSGCNFDTPCDCNKTVEISSELASVLRGAGLTIASDGKLLLNEQARKITTLKIEGVRIDSLQELKVLPNLRELQLNSCGYGPKFDLSILPKNITSLDLSGNNIAVLDGLLEVKVAENGDEDITYLRKFKKLILPYSTRGNIHQIFRYWQHYKQEIEAGSLKLEIENAEGKIQPYSNLRSIPDAKLRAKLKESFQSIFEGDQIDLQKRFSLEDQVSDIVIQKDAEVTNFEGIQYIINNPYWRGSFIMCESANPKEIHTLSPLSIGKYVGTILLNHIDVTSIDTTDAQGLFAFLLMGAPSIQSIDLTPCTLMGRRGKTQLMGMEILQDFSTLNPSSIVVTDCTNLQELRLPKTNDLLLYNLQVKGVPALRQLDLSAAKLAANIWVGGISNECKLIYPANMPTQFEQDGQAMACEFGCDEATYNRNETKAFLKTHYTNKPKGEKIVCKYSAFDDGRGFNWENAIKAESNNE